MLKDSIPELKDGLTQTEYHLFLEGIQQAILETTHNNNNNEQGKGNNHNNDAANGNNGHNGMSNGKTTLDAELLYLLKSFQEHAFSNTPNANNMGLKQMWSP